ncbi:MAG: trypsin-like peptidase domain-containing protein, partial [Lachnospiraceae bacterium]|nr:trypsin-like peptidase domain-containing protein [Lachnospiraceae bacterium]
NQGDNNLTISVNLATGSDESILTPIGSDLEVSQIVENCMPSVVAITNLGVSEVQTLWGTYEEESESCGSGVIIGKSEKELIILTNYHVVAGSKELTVVFSFDEASEEPEAVTAHVKGYEAERDIAVIGIKLEEIDEETMNSIKIAVIGDSEDLKLGEEVVAIGNALGYGQSVTTGIISALDRYVELEGTDGIIISNDYIQTDAAINPGNSGGALLNTKGELIGINSAKVSDSSVEGMGYAIPITDVYDLINDLMNLEARVSYSEEDQGYLCISGQDVSSDAVQYYGIPAGAYVISVYEGYAAEEAGVEVGDIITKVNDVEVDSMTALKYELAYYEGGAEVTLTIMRQTESGGYEEIEVTVVLNDYDEFLELQDEMSSRSQQVQPEEDDNQQVPDYNNGFWY